MKRRIATLCLLLVLVFSLTACIRFEAKVKIYNDGTADVRMLIATRNTSSSKEDDNNPNYSYYYDSDSNSDSNAIGLSEEAIAEYKAKGVEYEEYNDPDGGYTGYILSRKGIDLQSGENHNYLTGESILDGGAFKVDGKHVTIDYDPFSGRNHEELGSFDSMLLENYGGYMKFKLELPVKPTNHNATTVSDDGKTLTWDLMKLKANESVHAEFDMPSNSILAWLIPIISIILITVVVAIIVSKKKKFRAASNVSVVEKFETSVTTDEQKNEHQSNEEST